MSTSLFKSSIVKKQVMGATGLFLCSFLLMHLAGNCLIYFGPKAFNSYAHALISTPFIYLAEIILLSAFLVHIVIAIILTIENRRARGQQDYFLKRPTGRGASFASSTMPYTGFITLIFLVFHLWHIKYGPHYSIIHDGETMRDLYRLLLEYFSSPWPVVGYVAAQIALGIHVSHGLWSAFQSIGIVKPKQISDLKMASKIFAAIVIIGYSALPIYLFQQGGS